MLNLAALLLADSGSKASESWSFTVSVSDDTELSTGIPVNLYDQGDITMSVDWGDGSTSVLTSSDYSGFSDMEASCHTYSEAGEYAVTLTSSDWSGFYFDLLSPSINNSSTSSFSRYYTLHYFWKTLVSVDTALPEVAGVRVSATMGDTGVTTFTGSLPYMFYGCEQLTSLPEDLFANNTASTSFTYCFYYCSTLTSIPENLFGSCADVTDFSYCFEGTFYFDGSIRIKAEEVTNAGGFVSRSSAYERYIYVPAGSTTADTFNALSYLGITVVEE